jgi:membrane-bound serine protease (ClpP class)
MAFLRALAALLAVTAVALAVGDVARAQSDGERPRVLSVEFANDVNPITADYVTGAIKRANDEGYDAVVVLLDTPGGLDTAMREIIKAELDSDVPVVFYVYPEGSRAASAGVFLMMAADVAAMAPQTNIGSSTPISATGEEIPEDLRRKVVNDAAAFIGELAREHGRNEQWARDAVTKASNVGASEALEKGIVDVVAEDLPTLLNEIDGMRTKPKGIVLNTAGAEVDTVEMGLWTQILDFLVDPNLIVLLMSIGLLGITIEILNPGLIFPGTVGAICLIMGLFGLQVLPISWAGLLLMLLALGFFVAEAFVASHGALALAGVVSFVFGALLLFDPAGETYDVSVWVALAVAGTLALLIGVAMAKVIQVRRSRPQTGQEEMLGAVGVVRQTLDPDGSVFVHGELWRARAADGERLEPGDRVRVDGIEDGLLLDVSRTEAEPTSATAAAGPVGDSA